MAVSRFATNNLVAEHDVYVKYLKIRKKFIEEHGWTNVKEFVPSRCGLFDTFFNVSKTTLKRGLYKWHCMQISYDIWQTLVKHCVVWEGAIKYKKSVHVDVSILKKFKAITEQTIYDARCDYNTRLPHGQAHYDACRYLAMYWTYLDIIKDDKTQRYFPDKDTREKAAKIFGYSELENPFQMNGIYWTFGKKNIPDAPVEEETKMEEVNGDILEKRIEDLDLSVRTYNCLDRAGVKKFGSLLMLTANDILHMRNLGINSFREVVSKLQEYGYIYPEDKTNPKIPYVKDSLPIKVQAAKEVEEEPKEVFNDLKNTYDDIAIKYDNLLKTAQEQADRYDELLKQKLDLEAYNSRLRDQLNNLKDENESLKSVAESRRIASNPKNFDTFTLLNIVLEKMKDAKMDNIFITVDGMTVDIHKKFERPFGKAESYTIRTSEAR